MSADVLCVFPELSAHQLVDLLAQSSLCGAVVIDESGRPLGVVGKNDLTGRCGPGHRVADVMTPVVFSLPDTFTLSGAAALMDQHGVQRIPVVSSQGRAIGMVSALDVIRWVARHEGIAAARPGQPPRSKVDGRGRDEREG